MFTVRVKYYECDSYGDTRNKSKNDFEVDSLEDGLTLLKHIKEYNELQKEWEDDIYKGLDYESVDKASKRPWWAGSFSLLRVNGVDHYIEWDCYSFISAKLIIGFEK